MEQILGKNCNQIFSGAPYRVQKDQGHLVTSVFWPQGHRTRYKIIRGTLDPDHPSKFGQWPWDTEHWVNSDDFVFVLFLFHICVYLFGRYFLAPLSYWWAAYCWTLNFDGVCHVFFCTLYVYTCVFFVTYFPPIGRPPIVAPSSALLSLGESYRYQYAMALLFEESKLTFSKDVY